MRMSPVCRPLFVLLVAVLFATSCGGSDDAPAASTDTVAATSSDSGDAETDDSATADDASVQADDASDAPSNGADLSTKPSISDALLGDYDELVTTDLVVGDGAEAVSGDMISMQYVGVLGSDGTEFDASWNRGQPFDFALGAGQVIAGWDEGIVGMRVGGRRVLQIPSDMAYGSSPRGDVIGADADLLFIVDLIDIIPPAPTPVPPEPAPPVDQAFLGEFDSLETTDLVEGTGPAAKTGDILAVQYVGVVGADGTEFDSSWSRGATPFRVIAGRGAVIDGWNEGLVGMKLGGERILQIPAALAYGEAGAGGAIGPNTDLVFRVHLEELVAAPLSHTLEFSGTSPSEVQTTTLIEGDGPAAEASNTLEAHLAVYYHNNSALVDSTYTNDTPQLVPLAEDTFLPGVADELVGIQAGETRQIIVPATTAFPDGVPPQAQLDDDDALVFVVEALSIN